MPPTATKPKPPDSIRPKITTIRKTSKGEGAPSPGYNPKNLPRYNGNSDPSQFLMGYKAMVATVVGDEATLANSFVIVTRNIAQN